MKGYSGFSDAQASTGIMASVALKQCTSFDMHGLIDADLIRVRKGESPEILLASDSVASLVKELGFPLNDKRSVSLAEWKPSNAEMFKLAERKMAEVFEAPQNIKPAGPKMS